MSWCDRRILLILPLAVAACGFEPVYGTGGTASALRGRVTVTAPSDVDSYLLVQNLEERLGRAGSAEYRLDLRLATSTQGQAITSTNEINRYSIVGALDYSLTRISDGNVVASGQVDNFAGYSATGSTVESLAAERDARKRLMAILADQLTTRLYATAELPA